MYIIQFITVNQVGKHLFIFREQFLIAARGVSISRGRTPPTSGWPWEAARRDSVIFPLLMVKWSPADPDDFTMKFLFRWENDGFILPITTDGSHWSKKESNDFTNDFFSPEMFFFGITHNDGDYHDIYIYVMYVCLLIYLMDGDHENSNFTD